MTGPKRPGDEVIAEFGGLPDESSVCLAVYGADLDPEDVSARLGCKPTDSHRRGYQKTSQSIPTSQGAWFCELRGEPPTGPEQLIRRLLLRLPNDQRVWSDLGSRFDVQVRVAIHFTGWNKGFDLPPDIVAAISRMGATLNMDLYAYGDGDA
jgi:hypothetical protein